jgi:hypothetical protein
VSYIGVKDRSGTHPTSSPMGNRGPDPEGEKRPGREADHSHSCNAEVKNPRSFISTLSHVFMA